MKKIVTFAISLILMVQMPICGIASRSYFTLDELAAECIKIVEIDGETVYSNLFEFQMLALETFSELTDIALAEYIIEYAGLSYDECTDAQKIEVLDFVEIRKSIQLFVVDENANLVQISDSQQIKNSSIAPMAVWEDEDGYMRITTTCGVGATVGNETPYVIESKAEWMKFPAMRLRDTFAIGYGGVFDDSYDITARMHNRESYMYCGSRPYISAYEVYGPDESGNPMFITPSNYIELDFSQSHTIGMIFSIGKIGCYHGTSSDSFISYNRATTTDLYVSLKFRVLVSSTTEAKAAYAHKTFGVKDVSVGATVEGESVSLNFNAAFGVMYDPFYAAPITLRVD